MSLTNINMKYVFSGLAFVMLSVALLVSCLSTNRDAATVFKYDNYLKNPPTIRVLLEDNIKEAEIEINNSYKISDLKSKETLAERANLAASLIYMNSGQFKTTPLATDSGNNASVTFAKGNENISIATHDGFIKLKNKKYRGKLILVPTGKDRFSILEEIGIEEYLPGVIESEMPIMWKDDAIQAQVIAARTFAIYQKKVNHNALYHINKHDLAYNGSYLYQAKTKEIVDKFRGTVMVYNWELFPGYFHSTCGGHTEDINLVFNLKSIPPLRGVDCGYCNNSRYYRWEKNLGKEEIEEKLNASKSKIKDIRNITAESIGPGGHCSTIRIEHAGGTKRVNANNFRLMLGPNNLRSTAFTIKNNGNSFVFEGGGWGHGVGLCQYGTQDMAKSGFTWFDILKHYYPEIDLVKIY